MRIATAFALVLAGCAEPAEPNADAVELVVPDGETPRVLGFGRDGQSSTVFNGEAGLCSPHFSADGGWLLLRECATDGSSVLLSYPDRDVVETFPADSDPVLLPTRGTVLVGVETPIEFDPETAQTRPLPASSTGTRTASPVRHEIASIVGDELRVYDVETSTTVAAVPLAIEFEWGVDVPNILEMQWSPAGDQLLARAGLRWLFVLTPATQAIEVWVLPDWTDNDLVQALDWASDGRVAVSRYGPGGQRIEVYDGPHGDLVGRIDAVGAPAWAHDGRLAATGAEGLVVFDDDLTRRWAHPLTGRQPKHPAWRP